MDVLKQFDAYALRARLVPALLAAAPAVAALALLISWKSLDLSNSVATVATLVLLFAIADATRERGRAVELAIYPGRKGMPSVVLFRRNDATLNAGTKDRFYEDYSVKRCALRRDLTTASDRNIKQTRSKVGDSRGLEGLIERASIRAGHRRPTPHAACAPGALAIPGHQRAPSLRTVTVL